MTRGALSAAPFLAVLFFLLAGAGLAQSTPQPTSEVQTLLAEARAKAAEALELYAFYEIYTYDQPLWREAIDLGEQALALTPDDPEVRRFLASSYSYVEWDIRAWPHWLAFLEAGGSLDGSPAGPHEIPAGVQFAETGNELGFARYQAGQPEEALVYYGEVHRYLPDNLETLTWLGRIQFELARPEEALPYWQRLVELQPEDAGVRYYLHRTEERLRVGVEASDLFQEGLVLYEGDRAEEALERFEAAYRLNDAFVEAAVWAGRSSLELGRPGQAADYWGRVLELTPDDARAAYFLRVAQDQVLWGIEAADQFYRGQSFYERGDVQAAAEAFDNAARANDTYLEAWVWAARTWQELGQPEEAIFFWEGVLELTPDNRQARLSLEQARQERIYGVEAGRAFMLGIQRYQEASFEEAEALLKAAVDANPAFTRAWAWLGRVYFTIARYDLAAESYQRALELEPGNDGYRFFAEESRRLAE